MTYFLLRVAVQLGVELVLQVGVAETAVVLSEAETVTVRPVSEQLPEIVKEDCVEVLR